MMKYSYRASHIKPTAYKMKLNHFTTKHEFSGIISCLCSKPAFLFFLAFLMQIPTTIALLTHYPGNETDRVALLSIKSQLVDHPNGVLLSWNDSIHHCKWEGVTCGRKHNRVNVLDLNSRGLGGTISPFIGNLSFLKIIRLYNNSLFGQIPQQVSHIIMLNELRVENNTLVGEIPANISRCVNLRSLSLGYNKLQGELPPGLAALLKLQDLSVQHNYLRGRLFDSIQNLTSLVTISAADNSFLGTIPNNICRMHNLKNLLVKENNLSGKVPMNIFNLSSLQALEISYNQLQGELPVNLGFTTPRLKRLYLAGNKFSGSIPITIRNLTGLEFIELQQNGFTGRVPQGFGHFPNLTHLDLKDNYLVGDINFITTLVNCTKLILLSLRGNKFSGILPHSVANLSTTLTWLTTGESLISGTFPEGITNLINLEYLVMDNSELTGSLPRDFGKLQKLEIVDLNSNRLTGRLPYSAGNLSRLSMLYLYNNKLDGSIPESLGNCQNLLYLNLQNNHFSGKIPSDLFIRSAKFLAISFSLNELEGSLPFEIGKQTNLVDLEVSNNKLSGIIPVSLSYCTTLQYIDIKGNSFHGNIPRSFISLAALVAIDVSQNHLSGKIPTYLSKFPLLYLNLSFNDFEGRVPKGGVFSNASGVILIGNNRLCGGIQALHLPKCVEKKIVEMRKRSSYDTLKMVAILTACSLVVVMAMSLAMYLICRRNKNRPILPTFMAGETYTKVSYDMLLKATSGFSSKNLLGAGSSGSVFKGILDEKAIAVKVLNMQHCGASKSFIAECKALRNIRHRNLVGIITACSSIDFQRNDFRALVYEFMPNGSLDKWLHEVVGKMSLAQRVDVAIGVAHAMNYLHHECETPIVHCDLKPSNILLDNDMVARVGDFGLSKFLPPQHPNQSSTIGIKGTIGYAAPEYGLGSEASTDGDVYSYGILLLELITGKSPTDNMFKEDYNIYMYAEEALPDQVLQIIDPSLEDEKGDLPEESGSSRAVQEAITQREECIVSMISVGVSCSNHLPHNRMKITDAINKLQLAREGLRNARNRRNRPARGTSGIP